jgi:hypothetical protein
MDEMLQDNEELNSEYMIEYQSVISQINSLCNSIAHNCKPSNREKQIPIDESLISELCPRLWFLASDYEHASEEDRRRCFLETLIKGSFTLLAVKTPDVCLKVSATNIHIFFKIFDGFLANDEIM